VGDVEPSWHASHASRVPAAAAQRPATHGTHLAEDENWPGGHATAVSGHEELPASLQKPAAQSAHLVMGLDEKLYLPPGQAVHAVRPVRSWYLPLGQAVHALRLPAAAVYLPTRHGTQVTLLPPSTERSYCPAEQVGHGGDVSGESPHSLATDMYSPAESVPVHPLVPTQQIEPVESHPVHTRKSLHSHVHVYPSLYCARHPKAVSGSSTAASSAAVRVAARAVARP
jgi:hypothetical protein